MVLNSRIRCLDFILQLVAPGKTLKGERWDETARDLRNCASRDWRQRHTGNCSGKAPGDLCSH